MSTIRVVRRNRFTTVDREMVNDERLSFRARGILLWLLDKPDDWRCNSDDVTLAGTEGRDAVRTALRELQALDYIVRRREQDPETGQWHTLTDVFEQPQTARLDAEDGFPGVGNPDVGCPDVGSPGPLLKTVNEDCERREEPPYPPQAGGLPALVLDNEFDCFWHNYPRHVAKPAASRAYAKACKKTAPNVILSGLASWIAYWDARNEPEFVPHPSTWLNQERWNDDPPAPSKPKLKKNPLQDFLDSRPRPAQGELA